jgi:hypothetical protein
MTNHLKLYLMIYQSEGIILHETFTSFKSATSFAFQEFKYYHNVYKSVRIYKIELPRIYDRYDSGSIYCERVR